MLDADCHVLVSSRDKDTILKFLNTFLPERKCTVEDWIVDQNSEQEITDAIKLIDFCIKHPNESQAIYWQGLNKYSRRGAWIFFTDDGATIYGLTCFDENEEQENELLEKLKKHLKSSVGYISYVEPPPKSAMQYIAIFDSINKDSK